ncbi:MAG: helix-turn-helix domain-containing protein [Emticicia sp.]
MTKRRRINYYKTDLSISEFNDTNSLLEIDKIAEGLGINFSYSNDCPNVVQHMPTCEAYKSIILSIYKSIEPAYSLHENPTGDTFLNITIFIEKQYLVDLLYGGGSSDLEELLNNYSNVDENYVFQKRWLDISSRWLQNLEISLFATKIPYAYLKSWVHQYVYELAQESYEILYPSAVTNFKQDDIQKVQKLELVIKNTQFKAIPSISEMAESVGMSPTKFKKIFKETFGQSTHQYILDIKAEQAKKLIATNKFTISQVAYKIGFNHPSSLTRLIKNKYHVSPIQIGAKNGELF